MRKNTRTALALFLLFALVFALSACVQRAETKAQKVTTTALPAELLSEEDMTSIENDLNDAEQLLADIGLEEQIDVTPATEL